MLNSSAAPILIASDLTGTSLEALRFGIASAHELGVAALHVVAQSQATARTLKAAKTEGSRLTLAERRSAAAIALREQIASVTSKKPQILVEVGSPSAWLCKVAKRLDVGLVVLGSRARSGVGTTAKALLRAAVAPVVLVPTKTARAAQAAVLRIRADRARVGRRQSP